MTITSELLEACTKCRRSIVARTVRRSSWREVHHAFETYRREVAERYLNNRGESQGMIESNAPFLDRHPRIGSRVQDVAFVGAIAVPSVLGVWEGELALTGLGAFAGTATAIGVVLRPRSNMTSGYVWGGLVYGSMVAVPHVIRLMNMTHG